MAMEHPGVIQSTLARDGSIVAFHLVQVGYFVLITLRLTFVILNITCNTFLFIFIIVSCSVPVASVYFSQS